jgi:hypothetical protein
MRWSSGNWPAPGSIELQPTETRTRLTGASAVASCGARRGDDALLVADGYDFAMLDRVRHAPHKDLLLEGPLAIGGQDLRTIRPPNNHHVPVFLDCRYLLGIDATGRPIGMRSISTRSWVSISSTMIARLWLTVVIINDEGR